MTPTIAEVIFWSALGLISLGIMICALVLNPYYDPTANDPYRYCPKEEDM